MTNDLEGKVILLTGATEGIGKAAARVFAQRGATLVLVARNPEKGERVRSELISESGNANIELLLGDLSTIAEVRKVAAEFRARHDRLDILVNNAGAIFPQYRQSADGFEMTFALNHLAYFVLTHELLDVLKRTPGARVVSTSSGASRGGRIDLDTIARRPSGRAGFRAYADSKLANVLFTRALAKRLVDTGGVANCFHPGFVLSGFGASYGPALRAVITTAASWFGRTPERGADTLVWLATSSDAANVSGEYFVDRHVAKTIPQGRDEALAERLWHHSEELVKGH